MKIADSSVFSHRSGQAGAQHVAPLRRMVRPMAWGKFCGTAVLVLLLEAGAAAGQSHGKPKVANDTKEDIKQAQQLAERGDQAFAAGNINEALADYEQAVKHAPGDAGILRRAVAVRTQVVQKLVDQAESDALDGFVVQATDLMYEALKIDPGNAIVAERLAQMKQMPKEYLPRGDKEDYEMRGAAALKPLPAFRNPLCPRAADVPSAFSSSAPVSPPHS